MFGNSFKLLRGGILVCSIISWLTFFLSFFGGISIFYNIIGIIISMYLIILMSDWERVKDRAGSNMLLIVLAGFILFFVSINNILECINIGDIGLNMLYGVIGLFCGYYLILSTLLLSDIHYDYYLLINPFKGYKIGLILFLSYIILIALLIYVCYLKLIE